jgi:hypothetical protein
MPHSTQGAGEAIHGSAAFLVGLIDMEALLSAVPDESRGCPGRQGWLGARRS